MMGNRYRTSNKKSSNNMLNKMEVVPPPPKCAEVTINKAIGIPMIRPAIKGRIPAMNIFPKAIAELANICLKEVELIFPLFSM
mgnify:CR=1 FL=1